MRSLRIGQRRWLVCVTGREDLSREVLHSVATWQRGLSCDVRIVLLDDAEPGASELVLERFHRWAVRESGISLDPDDITACKGSDLIDTFERIGLRPSDVVALQANRNIASELRMMSMRGVWSSVLQRGAWMLIARDRPPPRRTLVVTDGTARTLPVLGAAFELAEGFDVLLSYFDSMRMRIRGQPGGSDTRGLLAAGRVGRGSELEEATRNYLRAMTGLFVALGRARQDARADLVVIGASPCDDGPADVLSSARLPCSVLIVPCST